MSYLQKPVAHHPELPRNGIGLNRRDYEGAITTLCAGCGHDAIGSALMHACFELDLPPHRIAKLSGIGCSSKLPTYFLGNSHGFNSVHGRMPSVVTGANLANRELVYVGVSGDGDTGSIGFGQFAHGMRRGVNMLYMVANNGVYGLTKGQFSATADEGSVSKGGGENPFSAIDLVQTALQVGASFVARSFSGDKAQLVPLIKAALAHPGFALIDCLSPCVTFNNHEGSTKSYEYIRAHEAEVAIADFVPEREQITAEYGAGQAATVRLHDGSWVRLKKIAEDYDPSDRIRALEYLHRHEQAGEIVTGLLYMDPKPREMHQML
ncbi:MAG: 2-oxoacid:ferredoxin oxidoreductase subunit beta, partial [Gammaproteobacteria bacterium]|nr:2-oxoacid:ferredoxin oxidoreductase subunit beta [Gammaproteobacteria bacterium]